MLVCVLQYSGDQDDKTWLAEHQLMPATGGKSYVVVLDDIREIALGPEYKWVWSCRITKQNYFNKIIISYRLMC